MELRRYSDDDLGKRLYRIFELYDNAFAKTIERGDEELEDKLLGYLYGKMLNVATEGNQTSIARWDQLMVSAINQFVYTNSWNKKLSSRQETIRDDLLFHFKEHTELLIYRLEKLNDEGELGDNKTFIYDWTRQRIQSMRIILLASFKNKNEAIFDKVFNIFVKIGSDRYSGKLDDKIYRFIQANIFMVGSYIFHSGELDSDSWKSVIKVIDRWQTDELFKVFLSCADEKYADKWRIDTFDHAADGVMRLVPNYDDVLKSMWLSIMLRKPSLSMNPDYYSEKITFEKTLMFTGGRDEEKDSGWENLIDESSSEQAKNLKSLIKIFAKIRHDWESKKLITEALDQIKVTAFRELVNNAYNDSSIAKKIFINTRHYKVESSFKQSGFRRIGVNQVFDKEAFIADWHSGYSTDFMAEELGRSTAEQQDKSIFSQLFKSPNDITNIEDLIKRLKSKRGNWLVVGNNVRSWQIKQLYGQHLRERPDYNEVLFKGIRQALPLQSIYSEDLPTGIFFIPISEIGVLIRKPHKYINDEIEVIIDAYSDNTKALNGIIKESPKWLQAKGDIDSQRKFLLKKVHLITDRVFKYTPPSVSTVYLLKMTEE